MFLHCFFLSISFNFTLLLFKLFLFYRIVYEVPSRPKFYAAKFGHLLPFFRIWSTACFGGLGSTLTWMQLQQERGHLKQWRQAEARRQRLETGQSWQMQLGGLILSVSDWSWPSTQLWRHQGPRGSLEVWWGIATVCCRSDLSLDASCQRVRQPTR